MLDRDTLSVIFLDENSPEEWMSQRVRYQFEIARRARAAQQWIRYFSNWPTALNALRQLWETGKVSELKSPFWESPQKTENK
jgi:hypothetical protein